MEVPQASGIRVRREEFDSRNGDIVFGQVITLICGSKEARIEFVIPRLLVVDYYGRSSGRASFWL